MKMTPTRIYQLWLPYVGGPDSREGNFKTLDSESLGAALAEYAL